MRANKNHSRLCACPLCKSDYDAGKRMSDVLNTMRSALSWDEMVHKWFAFKLTDGSWDGVMYDSKRDAVRGQSNEFLCVYIAMRNLVGGATAPACMVFLNFTRDAYDAGFRLPDPDDVHGGREVVPTAGQMDSVLGIVRQAGMRGFN